LLDQYERQAIRIEHVNVMNTSYVISRKYPFNTFIPCAVIVVSDNPTNEIRIGDAIYFQQWLSNPVGVFMQK
jgi:hypothetical protein